MSNEIGPLDENGGGKLDAAIDRAVRRMMAAEPKPGLRHRVLAGLEAKPSRGWGLFPRFAAAGFALAALLIAVTMLRPESPLDVPPQSAAVTTPAMPPAPAVEPPAVTPQADAAGSPSPAAAPRSERLPEPPAMADVFGPRDSRVAAASVGGEPQDDPATPEVEPGATFRSPIADLPPLRIETLEIPFVAVRPLRINPL